MLTERWRLKIGDREVEAEGCYQLTERWRLKVTDH